MSGTPGMRRWTAEEDALLGTMPDPQLAARLGRTEQAVLLRRTKLGIPSAPTEDRARTSLAQADIDDIRQRYAAGDVTQADLARKYGVDQSTISRVLGPLKLKRRRRNLRGDVPGR